MKFENMQNDTEQPIEQKEPQQLEQDASETPIESEITSEFVEVIEKSKLEVDDKVNLLLTKLDLKPASELQLVLKSQHDEGETVNITEEEAEKILAIIKESGLLLHIQGKQITEEETYKQEALTVFVARDKEKMEALKEAWSKYLDDDPSANEALGKAFGYPPTVIEAFIGKRQVLNIKNLPKEVRESEAVLFSSPVLSADNWQEEIKQGQQYTDSIKKLSSLLYEEEIDMMKKSRIKDNASD